MLLADIFEETCDDFRITVRVKTLKGFEVSVRLKASDTVSLLKSHLKDALHVRPDDQRLLYRNTTLTKNWATLAEYKITDNAQLFMVARMNGGGRMEVGGVWAIL